MGTKQAQAATMSRSCGDSATFDYEEDNGTLTISGSGTIAEFYNRENTDDIHVGAKTVVIADQIPMSSHYGPFSAENMF